MKEINTRKMKISQLHALVAVADCGNFSDAALYLELSQSAVSHAIASLEEELGVPLFHRGRHGAHLTPVGERVLAHGREILQSLEMMVKEASLERGLQGGLVRIASFRSVATHVLPGVIANFRRRFPKIAVSITEIPHTQGVEQAVRSHRADIGIVTIPTCDEFETRELLRDEYIVLVPPNAKLKGNKFTWEDLASFPLILEPPDYSCSWPIRNYLTAADFPVDVAYELSEDSTILSMVVQGLGIAILPRLAAEPIPEGVQVYSLPVPLERVIAVAVLRDALLVPAVFAFLDALKGSPELVGAR